VNPDPGRAGLLCGLASLAVLVIVCYGQVLFRGYQFAFRDAAHFYYPLYSRVQSEWSAGRLPLWEPGENGGTPLLGSPMAAVLYPGKVVFAVLPYAWAVRLYTLGHVVLAFWAMTVLLRTWGVSSTGAAVGGVTYAFSGPILSDYFNIIFLVGAAWAPLGFRAADGWLRLGRRWALPELALVLAMQVLGGDLEAAYFTMVCAFGYGVALARARMELPARPWRWGLLVVGSGIAWVWVGPSVAARVHGASGRAGQALITVLWAALVVGYVMSRPRKSTECDCPSVAARVKSSWPGSCRCHVKKAVSRSSLFPYRAVRWPQG